MNPMRLLGALALAAGGSLLLSDLFIGQDLLSELTGMQALSLRLVSTIVLLLGGFALRLGVREDQERNHTGGPEG